MIASATLLIASTDGQKLTAAKVKPSLYSAVTEAADGGIVLVGISGVHRVEGVDLQGEVK